jgi:hypothetical protein
MAQSGRVASYLNFIYVADRSQRSYYSPCRVQFVYAAGRSRRLQRNPLQRIFYNSSPVHNIYGAGRPRPHQRSCCRHPAFVSHQLFRRC